MHADGDALLSHLDELGDSPDEYESSAETEYLLRSPENARRLMEAIARLNASHSEPSDTNEAPTTHRPERSDEE